MVGRLGRYVQRPNLLVERASRVRKIQTGDVCWIFGVGRSGSTWFTELLDGLYATRVWHEPYFGSVLAHPASLPSEFERKDCFFAEEYRDVWEGGLRDLLLHSARARFGRISKGTKIVVKDINSPQLCPRFASIFPESQYMLLARDPFDVLDSHIDMITPGSWNKGATSLDTVTTSAKHIAKTLALSLDGFRKVRDDRRLIVRYEDLLNDPLAELERCTTFLGLPIHGREIDMTVEEHRFENHKTTGRLEFRRFGRAGIWRESGNFTPEVLQIAQTTLGDLRDELGYGCREFSGSDRSANPKVSVY